MAARLASPAVPQPKDTRRHDPPHRTVRGLRRHGFVLGLGREWLAWQPGLPLLWRQDKAAAQEIKVRLTIHMALEHLQPVDVPFHGAATPGQGETGFDRRIVTLETVRETAKHS